MCERGRERGGEGEREKERQRDRERGGERGKRGEREREGEQGRERGRGREREREREREDSTHSRQVDIFQQSLYLSLELIFGDILQDTKQLHVFLSREVTPEDIMLRTHPQDTADGIKIVTDAQIIEVRIT